MRNKVIFTLPCWDGLHLRGQRQIFYKKCCAQPEIHPNSYSRQTAPWCKKRLRVAALGWKRIGDHMDSSNWNSTFIAWASTTNIFICRQHRIPSQTAAGNTNPKIVSSFLSSLLPLGTPPLIPPTFTPTSHTLTKAAEPTIADARWVRCRNCGKGARRTLFCKCAKSDGEPPRKWLGFHVAIAECWEDRKKKEPDDWHEARKQNSTHFPMTLIQSLLAHIGLLSHC